MNKVHIIGAGLAGSEAAWQAAQAGAEVVLYEMRPVRSTPAHHSDLFGELVCSNSLRAESPENAAGLLKAELKRCGALIMQAAEANRIPAGGALAVDRTGFAAYITERLEAHPRIEVVREEVTELPADTVCIVASGPLTSDALYERIRALTGADTLYFYDAAAPIVSLDSVDMAHAFWQSRYDKGDAEDYLNCPLTEAEYDAFFQSLIEAEWMDTQDFEQEIFFEGCMPIETMASRGKDTLRFGPMKPVGLLDPRTEQQPYAVLQLRHDDAAGALMNLVGFQTRMRWGDQQKVFSLIPALKNAEFVRFGVMHRNTFMNAPLLLTPTGQYRGRETLFFAGQMTGVEGYVESTASGLICGRNAARLVQGKALLVWPQETAIGALQHYITHADYRHFQPMNINFGLMPPLNEKIRNKKMRNQKMAERSFKRLSAFVGESDHERTDLA